MVAFDNFIIARPEQPLENQVTVHDTVEVERVVRDTVHQVQVDTLRQVIDRVVRDPLRLVRVDTVFADSSAPRPLMLLGKVVQHNLGIAPGNSGSPIFNKRGEVVAIANAGIIGSAAFDFGIRADEIRLLIKTSYLAGNLPLPANGKPVVSALPEPQPVGPENSVGSDPYCDL